jgi:biotin transport system substrate-specific component
MVFNLKLSIKDVILISLFSALMVVGAYIRIPLPPPFLPVTFQAFFCAYAGLILGSRLGALSQFIYVFLGLVGFPIFSEGSGISYILSPSFGFLIGFILAAYIIGKISELPGHIGLKRSLLSVLSGLLIIYIIGSVYMFLILKFYMNSPRVDIGFVITANLPYMVKDLILYVIVALSVRSVLPVLKKAGLI